MKIEESVIERPQTLEKVAEWSGSLAEFGTHLRDWQHEVLRGGVHSKRELARRLAVSPPLLAERFPEGDVADAYLAAYAEWIADRAGISRPEWCREAQRVARKPWFATALRGYLLAASPASFRQRNVFTVPDPVFVPRAGRPRVSAEQKREKARLRQQAYRNRVRSLLEKARAAGFEPQ